MARKFIQPGQHSTHTKPAAEAPPKPVRTGARTFEVIIYNKRVRDAVDKGEHHSQYDDEWAENRYVEVQAESPEIARRKIATRYPKHLGFVIVDVVDTVSKFDDEH